MINCRDLTQVWLQFLRPTLSWLAGSAAALVKNEMLNVTVLGLFHDHFGTGCPLDFTAVRDLALHLGRNAGSFLEIVHSQSGLRLVSYCPLPLAATDDSI